MLARFKKYNQDQAYRIFVTDSLKSIVENTGYHATLDGIVPYGVTVKSRWIDIIQGKTLSEKKPDEKADNRSCEEVVADIWRNAGLKKKK